MFRTKIPIFGEKAFNGIDKNDRYDLIRDKGQGYNIFIFEKGRSLTDICKNDKSFDIDFNNYTNEIPPKFEFFPNRLEITSAGGLPPEFDENEFFMGYSVPRNKELMRVFKDLEMVEYLG